MALNAAALKSKMKDTIHNGLREQFGSAFSQGQNYEPVADAQWAKMAESISGIAADIIMEIVTNGVVVPGQDVVVKVTTVGSSITQTGPGTGSVVSPGKII